MFKNFKNKVILAAGFTALALGAIGLFLPLLPTTPFILLAAYLFARANRKYYDWMHRNRWFGETLKGWETEKSLTVSAKWKMVFAATLVIGLSFWLCPNEIGRIVLALVWLIPLSIALFSKTRSKSGQ